MRVVELFRLTWVVCLNKSGHSFTNCASTLLPRDGLVPVTGFHDNPSPRNWMSSWAHRLNHSRFGLKSRYGLRSLAVDQIVETSPGEQSADLSCGSCELASVPSAPEYSRISTSSDSLAYGFQQFITSWMDLSRGGVLRLFALGRLPEDRSLVPGAAFSGVAATDRNCQRASCPSTASSAP